MCRSTDYSLVLYSTTESQGDESGYSITHCAASCGAGNGGSWSTGIAPGREPFTSPAYAGSEGFSSATEHRASRLYRTLYGECRPIPCDHLGGRAALVRLASGVGKAAKQWSCRPERVGRMRAIVLFAL